MTSQEAERFAITSDELAAANEGRTVPIIFNETVEANADRVALRWKNDDDSWGEWTWQRLCRPGGPCGGRACRHVGLGRGDRVLLMIRNMPEFHVLDMAALFVGATPVSIYNSSSPDQIEYLGQRRRCVARRSSRTRAS